MPVDLAGATEAATAFFRAMEREDWATVTGLTAPQVIKTTQTREIAHLLAWAKFDATRPQTGATGFSSWATYTPQFLAEYGRTRIEKIEGSPSIAELAALASAEFFTRWLDWTSGWPPIDPRAMAPVQVIGAVAERADLVHIVLRGRNRISVPPIRSVPFLKLWEGWRALDNRDLRFRHIRLLTPPYPPAPPSRQDDPRTS